MSPKKKFYLEESFTSSTQASDEWEVFSSWHETILVSTISESPVSRRSSLGCNNVHSVTSQRLLSKPVESPRTTRPCRPPHSSRTLRRVSESGRSYSHLKEKSLHSTVSPISVVSSRNVSPSRRRRPSAVSASQMSARTTDTLASSHHLLPSERRSNVEFVRNSPQPQRKSQRRVQETSESRHSQKVLATKERRKESSPDRKESRQSSSERRASTRTKENLYSLKDTPRRRPEKPEESPRITQKNVSREATKKKSNLRRASMTGGVTNGTENSVSKRTSDPRSSNYRSVSPRRHRESMTSKSSLHRSCSRSKSRNKARPTDVSGHSSARNSQSPMRTSRRRVSTGLGTDNPVCKLVVRQLPHPGSLRKGCIEILKKSDHSVPSPKSVSQRRYSVF
jgi:hypothetical protein